MLYIGFGSETGTAEDLAERLSWEFRARSLQVSLLPLDDVNLSSLCQTDTLIIVCATAGQGEPPTGMRQSWSALLDPDHPGLCCSFAVFGLGDSGYAKFNFIAKVLHNRLVQLGGRALLHRGLGDDQDGHGYEEAFQPWLVQLRSALRLSETDSVRWIPRFSVSTTHTDVTAPPRGTCVLEVTHTERLTAPDHFQRIHRVSLTGCGHFRPGDAIGVFPRNHAEDIDYLVHRLGLTHDTCVTLGTHHVSPLPFASATVQDVFGRLLDIHATATRNFIAMLAGKLCSDPEIQERLQELADPAHYREYESYCYREKRSFVEVLREFESVPLHLSDLVNAIRPMRPRYFSAASAPSDVGQVDLVVAQFQVTTPYKRERVGLCSTQLVDAKPGDKFAACIRPLEPQLSLRGPLILIGPGTGIAPCRCLVQSNQTSSTPQQVMLFTGHRMQSKDDLFGSEWKRVEQAGLAFSHFGAFSRDGSSCRYVQHSMVKPATAKRLAALLTDPSCTVFVSGNAKQMPLDVETALVSILSAFNGHPEAGAKRFLSEMRSDGRYINDTW